MVLTSYEYAIFELIINNYLISIGFIVQFCQSNSNKKVPKLLGSLILYAPAFSPHH